MPWLCKADTAIAAALLRPTQPSQSLALCWGLAGMGSYALRTKALCGVLPCISAQGRATCRSLQRHRWTGGTTPPAVEAGAGCFGPVPAVQQPHVAHHGTYLGTAQPRLVLLPTSSSSTAAQQALNLSGGANASSNCCFKLPNDLVSLPLNSMDRSKGVSFGVKSCILEPSPLLEHCQSQMLSIDRKLQ